MPQAFNCPNCGAPLDYPGGSDATMRCPYCNNSVIVPEELRGPERPGVSAMPHGARFSDTVEGIADVQRLLESGNKIEAIKRFREITHAGLKEAKDAVERMELTVGPPRAANVPLPDATAGQSAAGRAVGCIFLVGLLLAVGIGLALFLSINKQENIVGSILGQDAATPAPTDTEVPPTNTPEPTPTPGFASPALTFGSEGIGPGLFTDARHIGLDGAGNIYVGEYSGGRVQVFDPQGKFQNQWHATGANNILLGMAVARDGTVFAVVNGNILKFNGATGEALGALKYPAGQGFQSVAVTADGGLAASWNKDWAGGIFTNFSESQDDFVFFDRNGKVANVIAKALSTVGNAELKTTLTVDGLGNLYAYGELNSGVFKFSPQGKFVDQIGSASQLGNPYALAADGQGRLYVATSNGIEVFSPDGATIDVIPTRGSVDGLAFDDQNNLYIVARTQVVKFVLNSR